MTPANLADELEALADAAVVVAQRARLLTTTAAVDAALEANTIRRYQRPPPPPTPPPIPPPTAESATCSDPSCTTWPPAGLVDAAGYCAVCGRRNRHTAWCGHQAAINRGDTDPPDAPRLLHHAPITNYPQGPWRRR